MQELNYIDIYESNIQIFTKLQYVKTKWDGAEDSTLNNLYNIDI